MASVRELSLLRPRGQSSFSPFSEDRAQTDPFPCRGSSGLVQTLAGRVWCGSLADLGVSFSVAKKSHQEPG